MESHFLVNGGKKLAGSIRINGAKNAALKSIAASILFADNLKIKNVPRVEDIYRMIELITSLGSKAAFEKDSLYINTNRISNHVLDADIAKRIRASIVLAGPLLARFGKVAFPYPGGCVIGKRPIDSFLHGWRAMGAKITEKNNLFEISASTLKSCEFTFKNISVTGTETMMLTAVLANGKIVLKNAAMEPEIPALADFLNQCGAKIEGAGTPTITISGTNGKLLESNDTPIITIPDRIETGSFLVIGALLGKEITLTNCNPNHVSVPLSILEETGAFIKTGPDWIKISRPEKLTSVDIKTKEYPGFPTDLQSPFVVLMTQAEGNSMVFETVFEGRLNYVEELVRMGAEITSCDTHRVIVHGPTSLRGREIESTDIRAGLAFVIAAMVANGESKVLNAYQIDRGYEKIEERLNSLGADIKRINTN